MPTLRTLAVPFVQHYFVVPRLNFSNSADKETHNEVINARRHVFFHDGKTIHLETLHKWRVKVKSFFLFLFFSSYKKERVITTVRSLLDLLVS